MSGLAPNTLDLRSRTLIPVDGIATEGSEGVVVDFGRHLHGSLRLHGVGRPMGLRVRFGGSISEAAAASPGADGRLEGTFTLPAGGLVSIGETGFRFVRIDPVEDDAPLAVPAIEAVLTHAPLSRQGAFECSDEGLNRIWETGAHTAAVCMQELFLAGGSCPPRVSAMALYPAMQTAAAVYGADPLIPRTLDHLRDASPLPGWMNGFAAESLAWVIAHAAWYQQRGDDAYLAQQRDALVPLLRHIRGHIGEDGACTVAGEVFPPAALQGWMAWAMHAGAELCHAIHEDEEMVECQAAANLLRLHSSPPGKDKLANALLGLTGLADARETNEQALRVNPAGGLTPLAGYFVLQARSQAGDHEGALELARAYWGGMLDLGATAFWEYFDHDWTTSAGRIDEVNVEGTMDLHAEGVPGLPWFSLCHAGSAGPTAWLTEHVLGLKPAAPGCDAVMVNPNLAGLDWAEGALPTPHGPVRVRAEKTADGRTKVDLDAPQSVRIVRR